MLNFLDILKGLWLTARDIIPVTSFLIVFQLFVLKIPIKNIKSVSFGLVLSAVGLYLFVQGLKLGLIPLGNSVGESLPVLNNKTLVVLFALALGYTTTLAEPALASMAMEIEEISVGALHNRLFVHTVAIGVAIGMGLGVFKIMNKIPSTYIIVPLLLIAAILGFFAPERITGIAFDTAGVTTGPVTVPLNMALAVGLSSAVGGSDPLIDGFGVVALVAISPVITVLTMGTIMRF